jgi:hypothetical protein
LHSFWSSFDLIAFDELSAYDTTIDLPDNYITYEVQTANFGDSVALTASLWYRSTSWKEITEKADEIAEHIGWGGNLIPIDYGYIWIKQGTPFAQRMAAEQDNYRRIVLNITADYLSAT